MGEHISKIGPTIILINHRDRLLQSQVFTKVGSGMNAISIELYHLLQSLSCTNNVRMSLAEIPELPHKQGHLWQPLNSTQSTKFMIRYRIEWSWLGPMNVISRSPKTTAQRQSTVNNRQLQCSCSSCKLLHFIAIH